MGTTTDPNDPRLTHGTDDAPSPQAEAYLVLSEEERAKGFVRPVRRSYIHVGASGPRYQLRDLTFEEVQRMAKFAYAKYEPYGDADAPILGRFWRQSDLDNVERGCQVQTTMAQDLAETWARDPKFYGATYCAGCQKHLKVDEFEWSGTTERLGS